MNEPGFPRSLVSLLSAKRDAEKCIARKIEVPQSVRGVSSGSVFHMRT